MSISSIVINHKEPGLCGYVGFDHKSRRYELFAKNSLDAIELLRKHVKPSKKDMYRCHVTLTMREDGSEVTQTTC